MRALIILVVLAGCHELYSGPANTRREITIPLDGFYSQYVLVMDGGRKPAAVDQLTAACVDPALCDAVVVPASNAATWPELRVIPKTTGKGTVAVTYLHPKYGFQRDTMAIDVVAATPVRVAIGAPLPNRTTNLEHRNDVASIGHCDRLDSPRHVITGHDRADVELYACTAVVEAAPAVLRYRVCEGMCPGEVDERYFLCVHEIGGVVGSASMLQYDRRSTLDVKVHEGAHVAGVCTPQT